MKEIEELRLGLETAYIDGNVASNLMYKPQFVSNNYKEGKKVLSSIEDELLMCDQFQISVAFITLGGIEPLLQTLKELEKKHISGEILTTNREWNTKVVSTEQGEVAQKIVEEFEELWHSEHALTFSEFYENYKQKYEIIKRHVTSIEKYKLQPNRMQVGFISNLRQIIEAGEERALLISATGAHVILMTGRKALNYKEFGPVFFIMGNKI